MKNKIRAEIKEISKNLTAEYKRRASDEIAKKVVSHKEFIKAETIFIYASTPNEPDTYDIINFALNKGKTVLLPKILGNRKMIAVRVNGLSELEAGYMGILEPKGSEEFKGKIDLAVIPCLSASKDGKRLGHGGGYYDTFLQGREMFKLCVCFDALMRDDIPMENNDIQMDEVISEMKLIAHRSGPVLYPEQTVKSAEHALSLGADMVEIDLRFDKDGDIVVCHDGNAERVFGVDKDIIDITTDEFLSLRHKNAPDYSSHLLIDYMKAGIKPLLLHIKEGGEENLNKILDFIKENDYLGNITVGVTTPEDVATIKKYDSAIPVLAFIKNPDWIDANIDAGADYVRLWQGNTTEERINHIVSRGRKVWIMLGHTDGFEVGYTSDEFFAWLLTQNIDGILINDINFALERIKFPEE